MLLVSGLPLSFACFGLHGAACDLLSHASLVGLESLGLCQLSIPNLSELINLLLDYGEFLLFVYLELSLVKCLF